MVLLVFFTKKRMLKKKLRSYGGIIQFTNHIKRRRKQINKLKNVNDDEIFKSFCCAIETPLEVSKTEGIEKFNKLLKILGNFVGYYKIIKNNSN